jgi:hypothetical protein
MLARTCQNPRCGTVYVAERSSSKFCGAACRQSVRRQRLAVTRAVTPASVMLELPNETKLLIEPEISGAEELLPLRTPAECTREIQRIIRQTRVRKGDTLDMIRYVDALRQLQSILEKQLEIEATANVEPTGFFISEISVDSVPSGHYLVSEEEVALMREIRKQKKLDEVWKWLNEPRPHFDAPRLTSDVEITDVDSGVRLDSADLAPPPT